MKKGEIVICADELQRSQRMSIDLFRDKLKRVVGESGFRGCMWYARKQGDEFHRYLWATHSHPDITTKRINVLRHAGWEISSSVITNN